LQEIEVLKSIFGGVGELSLSNEELYSKVKDDVDSGKLLTSRHAEDAPLFALNVKLPVRDKEIYLYIKLPMFYPSLNTAEVHFERISKILTTDEAAKLKNQTEEYLQGRKGQECILDLVQWVRDWFDKNCESPTLSSVKFEQAEIKMQDFRRILLWFSTIAPDRAKIIGEWAKQFGLTGLQSFGSPAVVVVEGAKEDVDNYIQSLRSLRWKKMGILWEDCVSVRDIATQRRFTQFDESMVGINGLQPVFIAAGLEEMFRQGLKIHG